MELNGIQKLAIAEAIIKQLKQYTDTRGGKNGAENLRTAADDELKRMFAESGVDRVRISLNDMEVGSFSLAFTKPVNDKALRVVETGKLVEWLRTTDEGLDVLNGIANDYKAQGAILAAAKEYGFMPDGCELADVVEPKRIKGTTLRVDGKKVGEALKDGLPQAIAGLIGGGE